MADHETPYVDAALAAVQDPSLPPEQVANIVADQCNQCVAAASDTMNVTREGDTPGLEAFFWSFWTSFLQIAKDDASVHDRLARILAALKAKRGIEAWRIWGEPTTDSEGWLSLLGPTSREEMNGPCAFLVDGSYLDKSTPRAQAVLSGDPPSDDPLERKFAQARLQWLNINAFLAKIWALDIVDQHFFAIASMRMYLEPLSVKPDAPPSADAAIDKSEDPKELEIEVAATWVRIAGAKMYACREIMGPKGDPSWPENHGRPGCSGGTWDGVDGYHPDRWTHWKQIFSEVAQGNWRRNVTEAAQATVEAMEKFERDTASA